MANQTTFYKSRKELQISIKRTLPNLVRLKAAENRIAFNQLLLEIIPEIRRYIIKKVRNAIQKGHFPKNKYTADDFIDQLFIEVYDHIQDFSNEDEFYVWLYKKTNELLENTIIEEEFDNLFFQNIDEYSKKEWDQMHEKFTAESDGDLIMKEELDDISYYKDPYTLNDIFIENTEKELVIKIDKILHKEAVDRHIQVVLHNLPDAMRTVFELFTKQHLTLAEIAEVRKISIEKAQQLLNDARKGLKISFFNRYD
ncbi:sigma-70 family RNA polymerase sigma factor [Kordia sp. YSTF-M3]|uniref:Sigma-70 family RNA polymerase sigma factor n=1 Tax=Kordia aestuariivivens TaxID=2759037 RepID=A0ABR7QGE2_9FLAO|nr:sigma-70 family RNA polymerase sigma factor [Kordia aestuariivivens]MBC8757637.1 sigma-70 family RNA polymerase sigma factor [Kordia aestuariivivens]